MTEKFPGLISNEENTVISSNSAYISPVSGPHFNMGSAVDLQLQLITSTGAHIKIGGICKYVKISYDYETKLRAGGYISEDEMVNLAGLLISNMDSNQKEKLLERIPNLKYGQMLEMATNSSVNKQVDFTSYDPKPMKVVNSILEVDSPYWKTV